MCQDNNKNKTLGGRNSIARIEDNEDIMLTKIECEGQSETRDKICGQGSATENSLEVFGLDMVSIRYSLQAPELKM